MKVWSIVGVVLILVAFVAGAVLESQSGVMQGLVAKVIPPAAA